VLRFAPAMRTTILRVFALAVVTATALRVLATGYLPYDDALRHAAKAVSGKPWSQILLMRPGFELDSNPGWHAFLGALHRLLGLGTVDLVIVSVVVLFVLLSLGPILVLRRPEAWLLALVLVNLLDPGNVVRFFSGRPFLVSSAVVPLVLLLWPKLEESRPSRTVALFVVFGALSAWVHGSYYLLALPVAAVALAGRGRAAIRLAGAFGAGIVLGALLTGHPVGHLVQEVRHGYVSAGAARASETLVTEFQPFAGAATAVIVFFGLLAWRRARRPGAPVPWRDPAAVLTALCWALGYVAARFWVDWGLIALTTLAAVEIQDALERLDEGSDRLPLASLAVSGLLVVLVLTSDVERRWSPQIARPFLSMHNPTHAPWLPDPGGIAYSTELGVFYHLFFANPDGPWRYALGFEPALMRPEDYAVYRGVKMSHGDFAAYAPWLARLRPEDRLYVQYRSNNAPPIPGLEWFQPTFTIWAGRLPRPGAGAGAGAGGGPAASGGAPPVAPPAVPAPAAAAPGPHP
jgi:hypothetical protein